MKLKNGTGKSELNPKRYPETRCYKRKDYKRFFLYFLIDSVESLGIYFVTKRRGNCQWIYYSRWIDSGRVHEPMNFDICLRINPLSPPTISITSYGMYHMRVHRWCNKTASSIAKIQTHPLSTTSFSSLHFFSILNTQSRFWLLPLDSHYYNHDITI